MIAIHNKKLKYFSSFFKMHKNRIIQYKMTTITYNKEMLSIESINAFNPSSKGLNDANNKTRENIVGAIINNKIPHTYYEIPEWFALENSIITYLQQLDTSRTYSRAICSHKGGRKFNFDFGIKVYYEDGSETDYNVELKFNASSIDETPQFVSPMKPSQYMSNVYEEYYYDKYLTQLALESGLELPSRELYLKQIHTNNPKCMKSFQDLYYMGCKQSSKYTNNQNHINFYELAKKLSHESIITFIENTELNIEALSEYLLSSQNEKIYMLYSDTKFIVQRPNMDDYKIISVTKNPTKNRYECISKSGIKLNVLLRWKNGNGIAFPAFQIS